MEILNIAKEVLILEANELKRQASLINVKFEQAVNLIQACKGKLVVSGVGKSGHVGAKIAATFASTGTPSFFLHPTEAIHGDLGMISKEDIILAISFSGESNELLAILPHIKKRGIKIIGMAKTNSSLEKLSDEFIALDILHEACPLDAAPTTSTTLTLALGDALAICLMKLKNFKKEDFAMFHPGGSLGKRLYLRVKDVMKKENLPIVHSDVNLKSAIETMSSGKLGTILIVDDDQNLAGILSDGDLRRALSDENFNINDKAIKFANLTPKTINNLNLLAYDALKFIEKYKIQILVITENKKPVGVLHIHDLTSLGL